MKLKNKAFALLTLILCIITSHGQAQGIKINFDKKVIYTDSLNLPSNCNAKNILSMLPELLERPGYFLINKYDIKIDDVSVGEVLDGALSQLRLCDIEKVEIDESPISSYQNYGQSGTINIWLRNKPLEGKKTWGSLSADMTLPFNLLPKFTLSYKDEKLMIRGLAFYDIYNNTHNKEYRTYVDNQLNHSYMAEDNEKYWSDMARIYVTYTPDKKNSIKIDISQVSKQLDQEFTGEQIKNNYKTFDDSRLLRTNLLYKHAFNGNSLLKTEVEFDYQPSSSSDKKSQTQFYLDNDKNKFAGKICLDQNIPTKNKKNNSSLEVGVKGNLQLTDNNNTWKYTNSSPSRIFSSKFRNNSITPYLQSKNTFGKFRLKAVAELQCLHYDIDMYTDNTYDYYNTNITGKIMAEWHFTSQRNIRLVLDRKIQQLSNNEIFPYQFTNPKTLVEYLGNDKLKNTNSHEIRIDYNSSYNRDESTLFFNLGTNFNNVNNLIREKNLNKGIRTFINEGKNLIFIQNFMTRYSYKHFAVTLTGNLYHNRLKDTDNPDAFHYYNICLLPSMSLANGWEGLLRFLYTSQVKTKNSTLGECTHMSFNLGKSWGMFNLHCYGRISLRGKTRDIAYSNNVSQYTYYYMPESAFGVGMNYSF